MLTVQTPHLTQELLEKYQEMQQPTTKSALPFPFVVFAREKKKKKKKPKSALNCTLV
jgi:hypothetical protein